MLKLYNFTGSKKEYWETWANSDGSHTVHWGELGTTGHSKKVKDSLLKKPEKIIQKKVNEMVSNGFRPIEEEFKFLIEYAVDGMRTKEAADVATTFADTAVDGMRTKEDVDKRHRLQDRMDETLGWTGFGNCDGGSIGSGIMEVCNFILDF